MISYSGQNNLCLSINIYLSSFNEFSSFQIYFGMCCKIIKSVSDDNITYSEKNLVCNSIRTHNFYL